MRLLRISMISSLPTGRPPSRTFRNDGGVKQDSPKDQVPKNFRTFFFTYSIGEPSKLPLFKEFTEWTQENILPTSKLIGFKSVLTIPT